MNEFMSFTLPSIADAVRDLGYKAKIQLSDRHSLIESASSGHEFLLICFKVEESGPLESIEESAGVIRMCALWRQLIDYNDLELDGLCNWYNRAQPTSKLYRYNDSEGDTTLCLEADVHVLDGMRVESFQQRVLAFIDQFEYAKKALAMCKQVDKVEISKRHSRAIEILHGQGGDASEAVALYRQNAYLGYAGSQNNFGDLFEDGEVVPRDIALAMYWYTRSSERGEPTSYLSLASVLSSSDDNVDALVVATQYAILASATLPEGKNKLNAEQLVDGLKAKIGDELYAHALQLARDYRPMYSEKWTMSDTPGPGVFGAPGSDALN